MSYMYILLILSKFPFKKIMKDCLGINAQGGTHTKAWRGMECLFTSTGISIVSYWERCRWSDAYTSSV